MRGQQMALRSKSREIYRLWEVIQSMQRSLRKAHNPQYGMRVVASPGLVLSCYTSLCCSKHETMNPHWTREGRSISQHDMLLRSVSIAGEESLGRLPVGCKDYDTIWNRCVTRGNGQRRERVWTHVGLWSKVPQSGSLVATCTRWASYGPQRRRWVAQIRGAKGVRTMVWDMGLEIKCRGQGDVDVVLRTGWLLPYGKWSRDCSYLAWQLEQCNAKGILRA